MQNEQAPNATQTHNMLLSKLERWYVNGWFRGALQRPLELAWLRHLHPFPQGVAVLEIGCGDGRGLLAIAQRFNPLSLTGIDADPHQVSRAHATLARAKVLARVQIASAAALPLPAQTYEVVLSMGCLHHVPVWQTAVTEVARVLRHGGLFYALEFYAPLLETGPVGAVFQRLFPHPQGRFTHAQFLTELAAQGLVVLKHTNLFGLAGFTVARRVATEAYD